LTRTFRFPRIGDVRGDIDALGTGVDAGEISRKLIGALRDHGRPHRGVVRRVGDRLRPVVLAAIVVGYASGCGGSGAADADLVIAFTNEHDLYVMSDDGSSKRRLARGQWYVSGPAWSPDGRTIAFAGTEELLGDETIHVMSADGSGERSLTEPSRPEGSHLDPAWSPDGQMIAFRVRSGEGDEIYVMNADGSGLRNLTQTPDIDEGSPAWSPDGHTIAFSRARYPSNGEIYVMNIDGTGLRALTRPSDDFDWSSPAWSPDGSMIAAISGDAYYGGGIYVMNADGSGLRNLTQSDDDLNWDPTWSPDGRMLAFARDLGIGHDSDIYMMNADGSELRNLTESEGEDGEPSWRSLEATGD